MNIDVQLVVGWVRSGGPKDAPAWITLPERMPYYGDPAFKEMTLTIYIRKSFLEDSTYDQAAIVIAHELSHIVLDAIAHPLRRVEKAVDLTAMLLGFRHHGGERARQGVGVHRALACRCAIRPAERVNYFGSQRRAKWWRPESVCLRLSTADIPAHWLSQLSATSHIGSSSRSPRRRGQAQLVCHRSRPSPESRYSTQPSIAARSASV
jgi:hypothetical protein